MYLRIVIILNGVHAKARPPIKFNTKPSCANKKAFTFQPELRSGYYTPMLQRPCKEHHQGTTRPLAFEINFRLGNRGNSA